jgi:hypothetical protein
VTEETIALQLDESGLAVDLPAMTHRADRIEGVPYRPVQFADDDLATALERAAAWLRRTESWLSEPVDVIAIHLDYEQGADGPYYQVKLLCNEEDLAGAPLAAQRHAAENTHR